MWSISFMTKCRRMPGSHMLSAEMQDTRHLLNLGALAVLLPVFLVYVVVVLIVLARVLLATCAVEVACLPQPRHGVGGIVGSMLTRSAMLCALLLLQAPAQL